MISSRPTRWGVIGLGVGNQHALTLISDPTSQLVSVCDKDPQVLESVASLYGKVSMYTSSDEMLTSEDLDAIAVASYDWDHAAVIKLALDRHIHVFAEKPVGTSQEDFDLILEALTRDQDVRLTTNTLLRYAPRFAWLKHQIDRGEFGDIVHVQADYLYGRLRKLTHGWRGTRSDYSVTLGGSIHMVDLLLWLVDKRPTSVVAIGSAKGSAGHRREDGSIFAGDSLRAGLLTFSDGTTASVSANFGSIGPHFHRLDVYGTEGTFMNLPTKPATDQSSPGSVGLVLRGADPGTVEEERSGYPDVDKGAMLLDFNQCLLGVRESPISEQEVMDTFAVCLALDQAVNCSESVRIEYREVPRRQNVRESG